MRNTGKIVEETLDFGMSNGKKSTTPENDKSTYTKTMMIMDNFRSSGTLCRTVYVNNDIDLDMICPDGRSNRERMHSGKAPYIIRENADGLPEPVKVELHHLTQREIITNPESEMTHGALIEIPADVHDKYTKALHILYPRENGINRSFRVTKICDEEGNHEYRPSEDAKSYTSFYGRYWKERINNEESKR